MMGGMDVDQLEILLQQDVVEEAKRKKEKKMIVLPSYESNEEVIVK